ncbi:MAG: hypothetical protein A2168_03150 [Planctomycetes bacterium RBG_13_50_24]|nr:MAG: hypothetical protein A2168_03150 [Planctomycetes bacterium RBG_13_50_24]
MKPVDYKISLSISNKKTIKTVAAVCFGATILASIVLGLLLNEEDSIKRHKISWANRLPE